MTFPSFKKKVREGLGFKTAKTDREMFKKFYLTNKGVYEVIAPNNNELIIWHNEGMSDTIERLKPLFNGGIFESRFFYKFVKNDTYFYINYEELKETYHEEDDEIFKVLDSRFANDRYFLPNVWKEYTYPKVHAWYEKKKFSDVKSEMEKGIINPIHWEQL